MGADDAAVPIAWLFGGVLMIVGLVVVGLGAHYGWCHRAAKEVRYCFFGDHCLSVFICLPVPNPGFNDN